MNTLLLPLIFITLNDAVNGDLICVTDDCKKISKRIKESLDESISPCEDFYKFACGNFLKKTEIPEKQSYTNSFLELEKNVENQLKYLLEKDIHEDDIKPYKDAKKMYKLCMDEDKMDSENLDPLKNKIKAAGGWPVLGNWNGKKFSILNTEISLYNVGFITNSLFDVSVDVDEKDNTKRILKIDQPQLIVPRVYLLNHNDDEDVKKELEYQESFMVKVAMALGAKEKNAKDDMKDVMKFMRNMAHVMQGRDEETEGEDTYQIVKLNDLQEKANFIIWKDLLKELLPKTITAANDEPISVTDLKYLKQLGVLLEQFDNKIIANYMVWYAIRDFTDTLTKELRNLIRNSEHTSEENIPLRWKECVGDVYSRFPLAISSQYVKEFFNIDSKYAVRGYIRSLRVFVNRGIDQAYNWLPEQTRRMAISKTYSMRDIVGYPDDLTDKEKLTEYYDGLNTDKPTYFESVVAYQQWWNKEEFRHLREFYDKDDWRLNGAIAEASGTFDYTENAMNFPAGYLQLPLYSDQVPKYINFAGIGQVAGNEFTQAFIDKGAQYDDKGNLHYWWDEKSRETFKTKESCFEDQYNGFKCSQTEKQVSGTRTLTMNMADNGGVRLAFEIYKQVREHDEPKLPDLLEYTPEKLFWIAAANVWCTKVDDETLGEWVDEDNHAPPEFRVNGVVMNSEHFKTTFECQETDKMNRVPKCTVWS